MKKLLILLMLAFSQYIGYAQKTKLIEKHLPFSTAQSVNLNLRFADDIQVKYWDKAEVYVKIAVEINSGKLNDALTVSSNSTTSQISLKTDFNNALLEDGNVEDCPDSKAHQSSWNRNGKSYYVCSKINYEVYLPKQAELELETISGNIWINSVYSSIKAKSISGFVDVSWPKGKGGTLGMKTVTGEVYSDLKIDFTSKRQKNPIVGYPLEGTVNGGGPKVTLESISNNLYVRSK